MTHPRKFVSQARTYAASCPDTHIWDLITVVVLLTMLVFGLWLLPR
jgi:hypothetical protein